MELLKKDGDMRTRGNKEQMQRKKNVFCLIYRHLIANGYIDTAGQFQREVTIDLNQYDVADNMDLYYILQEYEEYYKFKHNKHPIIVKQMYKNTKKGDTQGVKPPKGGSAVVKRQ